MIGATLKTPTRDDAPAAHPAADSMLAFTLHTKPDYHVGWHHRVLCTYLDSFVSGEIPRLMVFMPPRHGKSELVSRRLPAYILGREPRTSIIATSYSADLASRMNRDVQRIIDTPAYQAVFPNTRLYGKNIRTVATGSYLRNSDIFEIVSYSGVYRSAGVGGGITGMGANYALIDDPIKNREEADSQTYRDAIWEWYTSTFYTRLEKHGAILLTLTRWHEDDLAGRLLNLMASDPRADQWTVLRFPAIAEPGERTPEDTRPDGEPLWPEKYDAAQLETIRFQGERQWSALYQQRPRAREGAMFKQGRVGFEDAAPAQARRVRRWDIASSAGKGDYSAGVLESWVAPGLVFIEDVTRGQWAGDERDRIMRETAERDRARGSVTQLVPQDPGAAGKDQAAHFTRLLGGFSVSVERESGDKVTRADPFASQWNAGNVRIVRGPWNAAYVDELLAFPNGRNDDQVDGSSGGYNWLAARIAAAPVVAPIGMTGISKWGRG